MEFKELKIILKNLYKEYVRKHIKRILFALILPPLTSIKELAPTSRVRDPPILTLFNVEIPVRVLRFVPPITSGNSVTPSRAGLLCRAGLTSIEAGLKIRLSQRFASNWPLEVTVKKLSSKMQWYWGLIAPVAGLSTR